MKAVLENLVNWKIFLHFISTYVLIIGKGYFLEKKKPWEGVLGLCMMCRPWPVPVLSTLQIKKNEAWTGNKKHIRR